ncbi:MAG: hypothetical protein DWQ34_10080 [Planctomycetota bacterium]|nr:MAG: hypothetical protein DWQ34_10080 [Planctomycetota bacterium]REK27037.1 MAG: hypothetical protein DWQ41_08570 [Planctomycetota bacterium]REK34703.1 MAG: hypothetical protein DWQ45_12850 [Planctomycetota bacterium]
MKTKSPTESAVDNGQAERLRDAVELLGQQVAVLTEAVDRLSDELQWRNNESRPRRESAPPPAVLHSMPVDSTTDDWKLNRVRPESPSTEPVAKPAPDNRALAQLTSEVADLRQYMAAMILLSECGDEPELQESYSCLLEWASQEFDPEILRESLPSDLLAFVLSETRELRQPVDRQQRLFQKGDPDAESDA